MKNISNKISWGDYNVLLRKELQFTAANSISSKNFKKILTRLYQSMFEGVTKLNIPFC